MAIADPRTQAKQEAGMTVRDAGAVACHAGQGLS